MAIGKNLITSIGGFLTIICLPILKLVKFSSKLTYIGLPANRILLDWSTIQTNGTDIILYLVKN